MKTKLPAALFLSAALTVALSAPATAGPQELAPGVTIYTTVTGEGTGHNTWTVTTQVRANAGLDQTSGPSDHPREGTSIHVTSPGTIHRF